MQKKFKSTIKNLSVFLKTEIGIALTIAIIWKFSILLIGYLIDLSLNPGAGLLSHTNHWDAGWYMRIINGGYETNPSAPAFYPLFPSLVYIINVISFKTISLLFAGQIVNTVAVFLIMFALIQICKQLSIKKYGIIIALLLVSPAAFFLHVFYSEAIFIALGLWAYLFALKRQWSLMAIMLAILTSARLPSLLFIALCGLEFMRSYNWNLKKIFNKKLLYFLIAPIGFIVYGLFLYIKRGDFFAMFQAYKTNEWSYQIFNLNFIETFLKSAYQIPRSLICLRPINLELMVEIYLPIIMLLILLIASIYLILKKNKDSRYLPLGIFGLLSFVMFTLNSNVVSAHRYVLPCITIYIFGYLILNNKKRIWLILTCLIFAQIQLVLYGLFIANIFAG